MDHRGDGDNISPRISWSGAPKKTESFVLVMDSVIGSVRKGTADRPNSATHWLVYDIPKDVSEMREEISGSGASDVARLGMKDDSGQPPVVRLLAAAE